MFDKFSIHPVNICTNIISTMTHIFSVFVSAASLPACTKNPIPHTILYINVCNSFCFASFVFFFWGGGGCFVFIFYK